MQRAFDNSEQTRQSLHSNLNSNFETNSEPQTIPDTYFKRMFLIVSDSFELSGSMPTDAEKLSRAETWSRVLFGIVPENLLQKCFDRAFRDHSGPYIVTAYDIKDAHEKLVAEGVQIQENRTLTADEKIDRCPNKENHLPDRYAEIELALGFNEPGHIVPCGRCRPEDYTAARQEIAHAVKLGYLRAV